jgi:hypothetical protein
VIYDPRWDRDTCEDSARHLAATDRAAYRDAWNAPNARDDREGQPTKGEADRDEWG